MSQAMRKCVLCHMQTTKVQISLRMRAVWSAPCCLLPRQNDTSSLYIRNFKILAGLSSWAGQFVSCLVGDSRRHIFSWRGLNLSRFVSHCLPVCLIMHFCERTYCNFVLRCAYGKGNFRRWTNASTNMIKRSLDTSSLYLLTSFFYLYVFSRIKLWLNTCTFCHV